MSTTVNPAASVAVDFDMPAPGSAGYDEFRKTGKLPSSEESAPPEKDEAERVSEELDAAEAAEIAAVEKKPVVTRADSASAPPQKKKSGDSRIQELANKNREFERSNRELLERLAALESRTSAEPKRETAASQPAAETKRAKPKLADLDKDGKAKYQTIEQFTDDLLSWQQETLTGEIEGRFTKEAQARQQADNKRMEDERLGAKLSTGQEKYADFEKVALNPNLTIPNGSPTDRFIRNSDHAADVLYYLGQHPEIMDKFYRYVPGKDDAPGKLTGHWNQLVPPELQYIELANIQARLSMPTPAPKAASAPPVTQAPRPPHQVSGKSPAPDSLAKAVEDGDQAAFTRLENERLIAKRKASGGRR